MVYKEKDLTGTNLSNYKIVDKLGRGGMATVYKAHELSLNRMVALKVLSAKLSDDEEFIKRFHREAQAAAKLNHPNIVQIFAIGEENDLHFFAMEYIKGEALSDILKKDESYDPSKAAELIKQVAMGLAAAHKEGLIHRDIKPSNILIDKNGNAKIADFGIAFVQDAKTKLTREGSIIGTPEYLSPEQCEGKQLDGRSDIYSLGVTLYELLSGKTPYEADTPVGMIMKIVKGDFPPINEIQTDIPQGLQLIVEKMMTINRDERYADAEALINDLNLFIAQVKSSESEVRQPTNIMDDAEQSAVIEQYQRSNKSGSGAKAFLWVASILIILVGLGVAAKFLYFDKQGNGDGFNSDPATLEQKSDNQSKTTEGEEQKQTESDQKNPFKRQDLNSEIEKSSDPTESTTETEGQSNDADKTEKTAEESNSESKPISEKSSKGEAVPSKESATETLKSKDQVNVASASDNAESKTTSIDGKADDGTGLKKNSHLTTDDSGLKNETIPEGSQDKQITKNEVNDSVKNTRTGNRNSTGIDRNRSNISRPVKRALIRKRIDRRRRPRIVSEPPIRSILISLNGNNDKVELVSSYIQNRLNQKKYILVDPVAAQGKPVARIARRHMLITVNNMGTNTLSYYGNQTTEYIVTVSVKMINPRNGQIMKGPVTKTVRYTSMNIEENFNEAVDSIVSRLGL